MSHPILSRLHGYVNFNTKTTACGPFLRGEGCYCMQGRGGGEGGKSRRGLALHFGVMGELVGKERGRKR